MRQLSQLRTCADLRVRPASLSKAALNPLYQKRGKGRSAGALKELLTPQGKSPVIKRGMSLLDFAKLRIHKQRTW